MHIHPSSPNSTFPLSEEIAVTKIQAGFRGYRVRKQLNPSSNLSSKPNNGFHNNSKSNKSQTIHQEQNKHKLMEKQIGVAASGNGNCGTQMLSQKINDSSDRNVENRSATKIQAGVRGFLVRKKQKIASDAATKIQAGFRGFKVRKETQKLQDNSIKNT